MSQYSIHFVNRYGQTSVHPEALDCRNDAQATERARAFVCAEDLELWEGRRLVELFPREKPPANLGLFKGYLSRQPLSLQPFAFVLFGLVVEWQAILFAIATSETIELL
jgi:hypothetical protein